MKKKTTDRRGVTTEEFHRRIAEEAKRSGGFYTGLMTSAEFRGRVRASLVKATAPEWSHKEWCASLGLKKRCNCGAQPRNKWDDLVEECEMGNEAGAEKVLRLLNAAGDALSAYVRARNDGGVSMADLSTIADSKIRAAHADFEEVAS